MRIGFLTQWYEPEPGPAATTALLARELVARGHGVTVLTGFPNYPHGRIADGYRQQTLGREVLGGVEVMRVPLYLNHDASSLRRIANYVSFGVSAAMIGVPAFPRVDALWVNYSPITVALPMWLLSLARRIPTVCEVADLWPDTLEVAGLRGTGTLLGGTRPILDLWCRGMYAASAAVVHISPGVGPLLESRGVPKARLHCIPKSADEALFHPGGRSLRADLGIPADAFVLLYAGSMGSAQGLDSLLEACSVIRDPRLVVLMAGSGTHENNLRRRAETLRLGQVRFIGRLEPTMMAHAWATADLGYVSLAPSAIGALTMPSKTQAILAAGRPLLVAAQGDVAQLAHAHQVGFVARPDDPAAIAAALRVALATDSVELTRMGDRARALYLSHFSVAETARRAEQLLASVARPPRTEVAA